MTERLISVPNVKLVALRMRLLSVWLELDSALQNRMGGKLPEKINSISTRLFRAPMASKKVSVGPRLSFVGFAVLPWYTNFLTLTCLFAEMSSRKSPDAASTGLSFFRKTDGYWADKEDMVNETELVKAGILFL